MSRDREVPTRVSRPEDESDFRGGDRSGFGEDFWYNLLRCKTLGLRPLHPSTSKFVVCGFNPQICNSSSNPTFSLSADPVDSSSTITLWSRPENPLESFVLSVVETDDYHTVQVFSTTTPSALQSSSGRPTHPSCAPPPVTLVRILPLVQGFHG